MAQLRCKEESSEITKKNIEVCKEVVHEGNLFVYFLIQRIVMTMY